MIKMIPMPQALVVGYNYEQDCLSPNFTACGLAN